MEFTAKLQQITNVMNSQETVETVLKNAKKNYVFSEKDFRSLNSNIILQLFATKTLTKIKQSFCQRSLNEQPKMSTFQIFWHPNEFKIFVWISVCYAYIANREIQEFDNDDLAFIHSLFPAKKMVFLEYNLRCLLKQDRNTKQGWCQQQMNLLSTIIKLENLMGKWTDISFSLFEKSEKKYFRSSHKCREKWYNHLDPSVTHTKWSLQEDFRLFQLVSQSGTRWAYISKAMDGARTQHMVKNRYNSLYKKYSIRYQRYAVKKLIDIIIKDIKKKMECEIKNDISEEEQLEKQEKIFNNSTETEEVKIESQEQASNIKSISMNISDFLNTSCLLPEWQNFQFQQIGANCSNDLDIYRPIYFGESVELRDYSSLQFDEYKCNPFE